MKIQYVAVLFVATLMTGCAAPSMRSAPGPTHETKLTFVDMAGQRHDLSQIEASGRKSVLVFWQTWCVPCRREGPALAAAAKAHPNSLAFFGVVSGPDSIVDDQRVLSTAAAMGVAYPQIRDRDASLAKQFAVKSTPTIVVLGSDGEVLYRGHKAPEDWTHLR